MTDARAITEALGGSWNGQSGMAFCPAHKNTASPALAVKNATDGTLLLYCHAGCGFEEIIAALRERGISSDTFEQSEKPVNLRSLAQQESRARNIFLCSQDIKGTPAEFYLASRGIDCGTLGNMRFAPVCCHPSGELHSAMVSLIEGSDGFAVHCTYLDCVTGQKADVDPQKAMYGPAKGGAVRLFNGEGGLIVAEGIETCLSLQSGIDPAPFSGWAALSTSGMRSLRLPPDPSELIIAADGDTAGRQAAHELAVRAEALGWRVALAEAPQDQDWNDVLREDMTWL